MLFRSRGQGMDRCSLVKMGKTKARSGGEIRLETLSEVVALLFHEFLKELSEMTVTRLRVTRHNDNASKRACSMN